MSGRTAVMRELALGGIVLLVAILYIRAAASIPTSFLSDAVGAGGVPLILGWLMAGVGGLQIIMGIVNRAQSASEPPGEAAFDQPWFALRRAGTVVLLAMALLFGLEWIGYGPSIALFLCAILVFQGIRPSPRLLVQCVLGAAVLWLIFDAFLNLDLPTGRLF